MNEQNGRIDNRAMNIHTRELKSRDGITNLNSPSVNKNASASQTILDLFNYIRKNMMLRNYLKRMMKLLQTANDDK